MRASTEIIDEACDRVEEHLDWLEGAGEASE